MITNIFKIFKIFLILSTACQQIPKHYPYLPKSAASLRNSKCISEWKQKTLAHKLSRKPQQQIINLQLFYLQMLQNLSNKFCSLLADSWALSLFAKGGATSLSSSKFVSESSQKSILSRKMHNLFQLFMFFTGNQPFSGIISPKAAAKIIL